MTTYVIVDEVYKTKTWKIIENPHSILQRNFKRNEEIPKKLNIELKHVVSNDNEYVRGEKIMNIDLFVDTCCHTANISKASDEAIAEMLWVYEKMMEK